MPVDPYQIQDNVTSNYVSTFTDVTHFSPTTNECTAIQIPFQVPARTDAERTTITNDLNAVYTGRFHIVPTPK